MSAKIAAIVIDYDTKEVLFEINADTRNYPASLTKMMTLYILFDRLEKGKLTENTTLQVSTVAASRSPSKLNLEKGSTIKVKDAILIRTDKLNKKQVLFKMSKHIEKLN